MSVQVVAMIRADQTPTGVAVTATAADEEAALAIIARQLPAPSWRITAHAVHATPGVSRNHRRTGPRADIPLPE